MRASTAAPMMTRHRQSFDGCILSRKRHGLLGDLFEIATMLPWWIGVALALAAYIVFHSIATEELQSALEPAWFGALDMGHPWQTIADVLQYLLPLLLLFGALASENSRHRSEARADEGAPLAPDQAGRPAPAAAVGAPLCPHCGKPIGAHAAEPGPHAG